MKTCCSGSSLTLDIRREAIASPAAASLIGALNEELTRLYPEDGANGSRLDEREVAEGRGAFLVAYSDGKPIACGAVRRLEGTRAEIRRMYVVPEARGLGVSRALLAALEEHARRLGATLLLLETGERQPEALTLYARAGFHRIPPYREHERSPPNICMSKAL